MNDKEFRKHVFGKLENIDARIRKIENRILGNGLARADNRKTAVNTKKSLPSHIIALRDSGFFKHPLVPEEVHKKLESFYPCEKNRVEVALLRLQSVKKLRKASEVVKGKRITAYVW